MQPGVGESGDVEVRPDGRQRITRSRAGRTVLGSLAILLLLGWGVRARAAWQLRLDAEVSEALYAGDGRAAALDDLLEVMTAPGLSLVRLLVFLPVVLALAARRAWRTLTWVVVAVVLVGPVTSLLKEFFGRVRPPFQDGGARYTSLSFPSGHSSGVAVLVTVALVLAWPVLLPAARRLWTTLGVTLVLLVGSTRMWLGVHYLSDVVGGWALGLAWSLGAALLLGGLPGGPAALSPPERSGVGSPER